MSFLYDINTQKKKIAVKRLRWEIDSEFSLPNAVEIGARFVKMEKLLSPSQEASLHQIVENHTAIDTRYEKNFKQAQYEQVSRRLEKVSFFESFDGEQLSGLATEVLYEYSNYGVDKTTIIEYFTDGAIASLKEYNYTEKTENGKILRISAYREEAVSYTHLTLPTNREV